MKCSVTVVMPCRNEATAITETLDALLDSTRLPDEIIIADGRSTDDTLARIAAYDSGPVKLTVVDNPTLFSGGGRNLAIEQAQSEVILLCDFGNTVHKRWIELMVKRFEEDLDVDIVGGLFKPLVHTDYEHCMASIHYFDQYMLDTYSKAQIDALIPKTVLPGGLSIGFRKRIWEKVGGFPEWLRKGQDKMFSRKAYAMDAKAVVETDAFIYHHIRRNPSETFSQVHYYGRGNGQMRYVSPHAIKLAGFYGLLLILLILGIKSLFFMLLALLLYALYYFKAGVRKVYLARPKAWKVSYLWLTLKALLARDIGSITGHMHGWLEWVFVRKYKDLFYNYTRGCDDKKIKEILAK